MDLYKESSECRRISTPTIGVCTHDWCKAVPVIVGPPENQPPVVIWNCVDGHSPGNEQGREASALLGKQEDTQMNPVALLKAARNIPSGTMLFMVCPNDAILQDAGVMQAIANLRNPFKASQRTLYLVGNRVLKMPAFCAEDIPILYEDLPTEDELAAIVREVHTAASKEMLEKKNIKMFDLTEEMTREVTSICRGMTAFSCEDAVARKMRRGGFRTDELRELQRLAIESTTERGLRFETAKMTFDSIGGNEQLKKFLRALHNGPRRPEVYVRIEEVDKIFGANASGANADNTGTSQDQLQQFLVNMEENRWRGMLFVGSPGSGKSLMSVCAGNTFEKRTLVCDPGALKAKELGESERRIRLIMDILKAIGGQNVLFMATANRLDVLPPELQRRFNMGTWYFPLPNEKERRSIWGIQVAANGLPDDAREKNMFDDAGWVGSDIRNCCSTAYDTGFSLTEARQFISLAGKSARKDIERLEELAETSGFLNTSMPGTYVRSGKAKVSSGRKLSNLMGEG